MQSEVEPNRGLGEASDKVLHAKKIFAEDPVMGVTNTPLSELAGGSRGLAAPLGTSWGSEVDLTEASQPLEFTQPDAIEASLLVGPDEAEGGNSEEGGGSISLGSGEDEDDDPFSPRTAGSNHCWRRTSTPRRSPP
ncbi:unnamed protein product [Arctogadus glacialis]